VAFANFDGELVNDLSIGDGLPKRFRGKSQPRLFMHLFYQVNPIWNATRLQSKLEINSNQNHIVQHQTPTV